MWQKGTAYVANETLEALREGRKPSSLDVMERH